MRKMLLTLAIPALFLGCSKDDQGGKPKLGTPHQEDPQTPGSIELKTQEVNVITVTTADAKPLAGAQVLVGDALNSPFAGNFLTADENGQVTVPAEWTVNAAVTVAATGYIRSTYMDVAPGSLTFVLRPLVRRTQFEVKGETKNLPIKDGDGFIDFGLVMPALSRMDLLNFDLNAIVSPHEDKISVLGQELALPANISTPKQSEKYNIFLTATLDKPAYRVYVPRSGVSRIFVARGRFPFRETADALRSGKELMEVINSFQISGGGMRDFNLSGSVVANLPTMDLNFSAQKNVVAPAIRADETFISAAVANQSGYLIPTDFKKMTANQKVALNVLPDAKQLIVGVLMKSEELKNKEDRRSVTLLPFTSGVTPKMLPLLGNPSVSKGELNLPKISAPSGINPLATYAVLAKEEEVTQGAAKVRTMNPQWEIYSQGWVESMPLPQWPNDAGISGKKRWEVNLVGSQTTSQAPVGPAMIEFATHVTHNSIDF